MLLFSAIIFFGFGLIIGSFLNVVICRLNTDRTFGGRSMCLSCGTTLSWYELVPLLSFLALRGRCRTCQSKISIRYPVVELSGGIIFLALFLVFKDAFFLSPGEFFVAYGYYAAMFSLLLVVAAYDLAHKIIPDTLSLILGALAFAGLFMFRTGSVPVFDPHVPALLEVASGFALALPFALLHFLSGGRWMGLGDAKLALGLGWLLGPSRILSGVVLAFWAGALAGIVLVAFSKKYKLRSELPFAPFLVLGAFLAFVFGIHIF